MNMILCFVSHLIQLKQYLKSSGHTICTGFGHDLNHTILKFLFPLIEQTARGKESNGFCSEVSCWGYPLSHSHAQTVSKKKKIRLHVRHANYLGCPSAVWRDQLLPAKATLNWTQLVFLSHTNFAVRPDRWDFKGKISLTHPEKLPSEVSKLPWRSLTTPDPFILERKQGAAATN